MTKYDTQHDLLKYIWRTFDCSTLAVRKPDKQVILYIVNSSRRTAVCCVAVYFWSCLIQTDMFLLRANCVFVHKY